MFIIIVMHALLLYYVLNVYICRRFRQNGIEGDSSDVGRVDGEEQELQAG